MRIKKRSKVFVIGLDGATFDLIKLWVHKGLLSNFDKMIEMGVNGDLESTIPPETPPAWMSFVTGKNPGKHGIIDFKIRRTNLSNRALVTAKDRDAKAIWNILSDIGKKVGIVTVPVTYPPEKVNGFMISGFLTPPDKTDITYPPELRGEIISKIGDCRTHFREFKFGKDNIVKEIFDYTEEKTKTMQYLLKKYDIDFFMMVFMGPDVVHHIFWRYMDTQHPSYDPQAAKRYGDVILHVYQLYDEVIGGLLNDADKNTTIIVASDHGAGPLHRVVYINNWLESIGMLKLKTKSKSKLEYWAGRFGLNYHNIESFFLSDSKILSPTTQRFLFKFRSLIPRKLVERIPKDIQTLSDIDWSKTKAYSFGDFGQININLKGREPKGIVEPGYEYEGVRDHLIQELYNLEDPETGEKVVENISKKEELYSGRYSERGPDIFFTMKNMTYSTWRGFDFGGAKIFGASNFSAVHRMDGILIMKGPNIKKGIEIKGAKIIDIAPTILHIMGLPIPNDMDGKILTDAFEPSFLEVNPIRYKDVKTGKIYTISKEKRDTVENLLGKLGFSS